MALKKYGTLELKDNKWLIESLEPHVCIKLKNIFPRIDKSSSVPFSFHHTAENCADLLWFTERYPLEISSRSLKLLNAGKKQHDKIGNDIEQIFLPGYVPENHSLKNGYKARKYQRIAADFHKIQKRYLLGDDMGLGKTLTAILSCMNPEALPALVVVQAHLPKQWAEEGVRKFTTLKPYIIKGTKPYNLIQADVYIMSYSCLSGWVDFFQKGFFRSVIFDEAQELRRTDSQKYQAAKVLSKSADYCLAMSGTPIYNYGDEIFNVLNLVNPGCLGDRDDFLREWCRPYGNNHWIVKDTKALGTYLRDSRLMLRRTREDVGRELPVINTIIQNVEYDHDTAEKGEEIAMQLALTVTSGSFVERGQAARELNALLRHDTGLAKAKSVAAFVKIILESGEPVVLAGWHRSVYQVWMEELKEFNPILYTGSETAAGKNRSKEAFMKGESKVLIISLRSGIGLDGLQHVCKTVVVGELDWSPKVHEQLVARVDRDGQKWQVTAYYCICEYGSDPVMKKILGLKNMQATGIMNPLSAVKETYSDDTRIKMLAESFLEKRRK